MRMLPAAILALLAACVCLRRQRYEQEVAWDDGDRSRIEVWLRDGDWRGPFGEFWGLTVIGDVLFTPVWVLLETQSAVEAACDPEVDVRGGVFGYVVSLLPWFTCVGFDPLSSRWQVLHRPLSLPAQDRFALAKAEPDQRIEWLIERYASALGRAEDHTKLEELRGWVTDVQFVPAPDQVQRPPR